jgi:CheY-like chemotaxis protein
MAVSNSEDLKNLLIVDRSKEILDLFTQQACIKGFHVYRETNPLRALDYVRKKPHRIHGIICDYQMLEINGLQFLIKLREVDCKAPFILTFDQALSKLKLEQAELFGAIEKPPCLKKLSGYLDKLRAPLLS